jgi:hypothetical protein
MRVSVRRVVLVTLGLSVVGAICGALLGGLALFAEVLPMEVVGAGAVIGAGFGAVLAPLVGWVFLRRVSLSRAIRETALGALLGIGVGAIAQHGLSAILGLVGFVIAGVRLWFATRPSAQKKLPR